MADLSVTAASVVTSSGNALDGTAGATITAGQVLYVDTADSNKLKLAQADGTALQATVAGIALHGAASGQPIRYQATGTINVGATLTVGQVYVVSATAGSIAPYSDLTSSDYVSVLGVATTAAILSMQIQNSGVEKP